MLQRVAVSLAVLAAIIIALQLLPSAADGADKCPRITATGISGEGKSAQFSANVTGAEGGVTFNWSVSDGGIASGQGTPQIAVTEVAGGSVTATVEIGGIPASCTSTASETVEF